MVAVFYGRPACNPELPLEGHAPWVLVGQPWVYFLVNRSIRATPRDPPKENGGEGGIRTLVTAFGRKPV